MTTFEHLERHRSPGSAVAHGVAVLAADSQARLGVMLIGFWGGFWLLTGLDQFFNQPTFFGVARDGDFIAAFARIGLPEPVALTALYGLAAGQVVLGVAFVVGLVSTPRLRGLITLCMEASVALLMVSAAGDILVGARDGLFEHSGYIGLAVLSIMFLRQGRRETGAAADPR